MDIAWVRLELDLTNDELPEPDINAELADLHLTTLAELGDTDVNRYRMFELNRECSADIPGRGPFHTWEEYRRVRLDIPTFDARNISLAVDGDDWVGMAGFTAHPKPVHDDAYLFSEMTGVVRHWRRKGLATELKMHNLELARQRGLPTMRTVHHPGNTAMIALNRNLGFVDATWKYPA